MVILNVSRHSVGGISCKTSGFLATKGSLELYWTLALTSEFRIHCSHIKHSFHKSYSSV